MKLKSIRLLGFKSFADDTRIDLGSGISCIVGPNGCGKSNILDAFRWVLGEKSAKGLRGQHMEDLIFVGTSLRQAAGMAEVEIHFENKDRGLNVDQDQVKIARRLYVSSVSEYYLNETRTTRKAVEKILLDTGIGKSSYSILEQGKISDVLRSTPEERRILLDEAAGIARFKWERQEAIQALQKTESNLQRLNDIWKTKEKEKLRLQEQAAKTQRYKELKAKLDQHDRRMRYLDLRKLYEQLQETESRLAASKKKREQHLLRMRELEEEQAHAAQQRQSKIEEIHSLDSRSQRDKAQLHSMQNRRLHLQSSQKEGRLRIEDLDKRLHTEGAKHRSIQKQIEKDRQLEFNLAVDIDKLRSTKTSIQNKISASQAAIENNLEQQKTKQDQARQAESRHKLLLDQLKNVTRDLIMDLEQKKEGLKKREQARSNLKKKIEKQLKALEESHKHILQLLQDKELEEAGAGLRELSCLALLEDFQAYDAIEAEFRSLLFDPSGLLAAKENLDQEMYNLAKDAENMQEEIGRLEGECRELRSDLESSKNTKQELDLRIRDHEVRKESQQEQHKSRQQLLHESKERLDYFAKEKELQAAKLAANIEDEKKLIEEIAKLQESLDRQNQQIAELRPQVEQNNKLAGKINDAIKQNRLLLEESLPEMSRQERIEEQLRVKINQKEEKLYHDFQLTFAELKKEMQSAALQYAVELEGMRKLEEEIKALGAFNALALEELEKSQKEMEELRQQRSDVEEARKNILQALEDMEKESQQLFETSFKAVNQKFEEVFRRLFGGGKAYLKLIDEKDILKSGVDIMIQPPGKKNTSIALLSGGEQSMSAIALIFALYLVKPSPFCFLDEIDSNLDEANVKRFMNMLKDYTENTQFLIITHNKITMSYAKSIYGVTQQEVGVSRLVSLSLRENKTKQTA